MDLFAKLFGNRTDALPRAHTGGRRSLLLDRLDNRIFREKAVQTSN